MSMESAEKFVKMMYEDDEFLKELFRSGAFIGGKADSKEDEEAQMQKLADISGDFGYDFTKDEYTEANNAYIQNAGAWKGMKIIAHMMKIGKAVEKEKK